MAKMGFKRNINIGRVVSKIVGTVLAIYVGGMIITEIGAVMNSTCSPFYRGLQLIGWSVGNQYCTTISATSTNTIYDTTSNAGILAVVGLIGIASIVVEFVELKM